MTRYEESMPIEEAIEILKRKTTIPNDGESFDTINEAFDIAIKALEHMNAIGKIRAEIDALEEGITSYHNDRPWVYKDEVLQIIDKYTKE